MLGETEIPIQIEIDGKPVRSRTLATSIGAYVLVIATVLPDQAIDLHSTYTGHEHTDTLASHLLLATGAYDTISAQHDHDQLPVMYARRHCLYDHLHHLQDLLDRLGIAATIPLDERAVETIER